jgi:hypothetical protein
MRKNNNYKHSMALPIILSFLDISIPDNATPLFNFSLGILILAIISLLCFFNVIGYLISIILINKYEIETKFPKLKRLINYYSKSTLIFVAIEGAICIFLLLCIIFSCLLMLGVIIVK